ncbi:hypothetical protein EJP617_17170 [Erwinia sp. Ejp617]|nr:hypothetical protein EJP617_17170 [Erwinia sp. Ejp617]
MNSKTVQLMTLVITRLRSTLVGTLLRWLWRHFLHIKQEINDRNIA